MIQVKVHPEGALAALATAGGQFPYIVSVALNRTANIGQEAERKQMRGSLHLRQERFVVRGIKIDKADRATKTSWRVVIQLAYPDDRHFLDQHEEGGDRIRHGGKRLWKPNKEVFKSKIIGRANPLHPSNLHLHLDEGGRIVGDQRTFLVRVSSGKVLILQRVDRRIDRRGARLSSFTLDNVAVGMGPRRRKEKALHRTVGTRLLYKLVDRVRIPADLKFVPTISQAALDAFPDEFHRAAVEALGGNK